MATLGNPPEVVSLEEWLTARKELLAKEKELYDQEPYVTQATTAVTDFLDRYLPDPRPTREM
jgi:predicted dithiol-disulfide oxidoreductase (DUF899 family)